MGNQFLNLIIGDLDEKKEYKHFMKRVNALPNDYRIAYRKIQHHAYIVGIPGADMTVLMDLVELFESSAADGKLVLDIIGNDIGKFYDDLMRASAVDTGTLREKLNREIFEHFNKEGQ